MRQVAIELDEDTAEALAMRIDDSMPTVEDVARHVLAQASSRRLEEVGFRRPCQCGSLERAAENPDSLVVFDTMTNEYHIVDTVHGRSELVVYYCFFCGGKAPISKRGELFARVSPDEKARLVSLCKDIRTFDDAMRVFGPPDQDMPSGLMLEVVNESGSSESTFHRVIVYTGLSDAADVRFTHTLGDQVSTSFQGKYLGEKVGG